MLEMAFSNRILTPSITLALYLLTFSTLAADSSSLAFQILQNTSFDGCPYSGEVAISVDYELTGASIGELIVSSLSSGQQSPLAQKEVESGAGSTVFVFQLNDCIDDISVSLNPF